MRIRLVDVLDLLSNGLIHKEILDELPDLEEEDIRAAIFYARRRMDHTVIAVGGFESTPTSPRESSLGSTRPLILGGPSLRGIGLRDADDLEIFERARAENVIFITKNSDFGDLVEVRGAPPKVTLLKCGNTTNQKLRKIFAAHLNEAIARFDEGEIVVEIE